MRHWIDEASGSKMSEPDCADEWLQLIWQLGVDYDGWSSADSLKKLIDELVDMSQKARDCIRDGKLFPETKSPETPVPTFMEWVSNKLCVPEQLLSQMDGEMKQMFRDKYLETFGFAREDKTVVPKPEIMPFEEWVFDTLGISEQLFNQMDREMQQRFRSMYLDIYEPRFVDYMAKHSSDRDGGESCDA